MFMFNCCKPLIRPERSKEVSLTPGVESSATAAPEMDAEMMRSKSESRILQRTAPPMGANDRRSSIGSSAHSLFEASAYRVAAHESELSSKSGMPDVEHGGIPERFLQMYVAALRDSNVHWASAPELANMFHVNAKLISQDKQTTVGKANIIKKLEQGKKAILFVLGEENNKNLLRLFIYLFISFLPGVEILIKMAGKDASIPEWDVKGPILTDALTHQLTCTLKRGMMKLSFTLDFTIMDGKITQLRNTRS